MNIKSLGMSTICAAAAVGYYVYNHPETLPSIVKECGEKALTYFMHDQTKYVGLGLAIGLCAQYALFKRKATITPRSEVQSCLPAKVTPLIAPRAEVTPRSRDEVLALSKELRILHLSIENRAISKLKKRDEEFVKVVATLEDYFKGEEAVKVLKVDHERTTEYHETQIMQAKRQHAFEVDEAYKKLDVISKKSADRFSEQTLNIQQMPETQLGSVYEDLKSQIEFIKEGDRASEKPHDSIEHKG